MANRRGTFAKRQRETDLKDKARAKLERRAAKRTEVRTEKGPQIAWDEAVTDQTGQTDDLPLNGDDTADADNPDSPLTTTDSGTSVIVNTDEAD